MKRASFLIFAAATAASLGVNAQTFKTGEIEVERAWARAMPKGAVVGAAYLTVRNQGDTPDRLVGVTSDLGEVQEHEVTSEGGVMKMRLLKDGLPIPAHGVVTLAPGGSHLMFIHPKKPLTEGDTVGATLAFERAGAVAVEFAIRAVGAKAPFAAD